MNTMKEKDMLKNMFEQEHKSTALDLSSDEILTAKLGRGAMIRRSRGAAIAAAAAAIILAVGIGIYALNSGIETADPALVAKDTTSSQAELEQELNTDISILVVSDAGVIGKFDLTDSDIRNEAQAFLNSFFDAPYSDHQGSDIDKNSFYDYLITIYDTKNGRIIELRMTESNIIQLSCSYPDGTNETYYVDGNKNKELYRLVLKCKEAGDKMLDEQNKADPYSLNVYVSDNDDVSGIDLKENSIDYSEFTGKLDSFYKAFKADTLPESVTVEQVDGIMLKSPYLGVTMVEGNVHLEFQLAKEKGSSLYMTEYTYTGKAVESFVEYKISDNAEIYKYLKDMWSKVGNKNKTPDEKTVTSDEDTTTTTTQQTTKKTTTKKTTTTKTANNTAKKTSKVTTVSWTPDMKYSSDEIQPLPLKENYPEDMTIVHFRRPRDTENSQSAMSFELIDEYEDLIKGVYDSYKSGEIKPSETVALNDDPHVKTWGTMMYVYWYDESDGGLVQFLGVDINEDIAFIRLTDLDSREDDCATGKVFYFDKQSEVYKQIKAIWDFYYPIYESVE